MSKIAWTEQTWNPIVGYSRASEGCDHCYAETMANRLAAMARKGNTALEAYADVVDENGKWAGGTSKVDGALLKPLHWRKDRMIFVCSMSDLFHPNTPDWQIDEVFGVMLACAVFENYGHTFQVLTKRPERMRQYLSENPVDLMMRWASMMGSMVTTADEMETVHSFLNYDPEGYAKEFMPLPNVWIGVTAENQEQADKRIPHLLDTPAATRFVSIEPMLGPVNISRYVSPFTDCSHYDGGCLRPENPFACTDDPASEPESCRSEFCVFGRRGIDWVICGCESGPGRRLMKWGWVFDLLGQCRQAGVPFFMKQLSKGSPAPLGKVFKDMADFPPEFRVREFPNQKGGAA